MGSSYQIAGISTFAGSRSVKLATACAALAINKCRLARAWRKCFSKHRKSRICLGSGNAAVNLMSAKTRVTLACLTKCFACSSPSSPASIKESIEAKTGELVEAVKSTHLLSPSRNAPIWRFPLGKSKVDSFILIASFFFCIAKKTGN